MLQLVRIDGATPDGFDALRAEADAEGHRHMSRLAEELASGRTRFEALLGAYLDGDLVGIAGLTPEPAETPQPALRMRRLYVAQRARRSGVASVLATALLQEAWSKVGLVTVHAGSAEASAFWEALGFAAARDRPWSHQLGREP